MQLIVQGTLIVAAQLTLLEQGMLQAALDAMTTVTQGQGEGEEQSETSRNTHVYVYIYVCVCVCVYVPCQSECISGMYCCILLHCIARLPECSYARSFF